MQYFFIITHLPNMPDSLLGISIPPLLQKKHRALPSLPPLSGPHPRVRGRSPLGSESCRVPPSLVSPNWSAEKPPPSRHRCSLDGCQNSLGFQVPALSSTSEGAPSSATQHTHFATYGLVRGSQEEPEQRESQQGGEDLTSGTILLPQGQALKALSQEGTWGESEMRGTPTPRGTKRSTDPARVRVRDSETGLGKKVVRTKREVHGGTGGRWKANAEKGLEGYRKVCTGGKQLK